MKSFFQVSLNPRKVLLIVLISFVSGSSPLFSSDPPQNFSNVEVANVFAKFIYHLHTILIYTLNSPNSDFYKNHDVIKILETKRHILALYKIYEYIVLKINNAVPHSKKLKFLIKKILYDFSTLSHQNTLIKFLLKFSNIQIYFWDNNFKDPDNFWCKERFDIFLRSTPNLDDDINQIFPELLYFNLFDKLMHNEYWLFTEPFVSSELALRISENWLFTEPFVSSELDLRISENLSTSNFIYPPLTYKSDSSKNPRVRNISRGNPKLRNARPTQTQRTYAHIQPKPVSCSYGDSNSRSITDPKPQPQRTTFTQTREPYTRLGTHFTSTHLQSPFDRLKIIDYPHNKTKPTCIPSRSCSTTDPRPQPITPSTRTYYFEAPFSSIPLRYVSCPYPSGESTQCFTTNPFTATIKSPRRTTQPGPNFSSSCSTTSSVVPQRLNTPNANNHTNTNKKSKKRKSGISNIKPQNPKKTKKSDFFINAN